MAKIYKGSLTLEWFNKQKSIILQKEQEKQNQDFESPMIKWVNQDESLFYLINQTEGKGIKPYWVDRNDIRVKEARSLVFSKGYKAVKGQIDGQLEGLEHEWKLQEFDNDDPEICNILIKGDNLLALNSLRKLFSNKRDEDKIKCIYIDPPYNTGNAFEDYDDNLEHSQWLTLMRDRIEILYDLLKSDGFLICQIDDKELPYLAILLHDKFSRENVKIIAVKMAEPTGLKMASVIKKGNIPKLKEYLIVCGKSGINNLDMERVPKEKWDSEYRMFIKNITKEEIEEIKFIRDNEDRTVEDIVQADSILSKFELISLSEAYRNDAVNSESDKENFNFENAWRIIQVVSISGSAKNIADEKRAQTDNNFFSIITPEKKMYLIRNGYDENQDIPRIKVLFADDYLTTHPGDFWQDIKTTGLDNEGNVDLKQSKKPERLIYRIIRMATKEGDYVLDCFGGSGTTFSVSHKMNRKWIGIELGEHADTKIIPRLNNVLIGKDQSPLIDRLHWSGGGAYKYYNLGESIISYKDDGSKDFNWNLGIENIEESFLNSYDFKLIDNDFILIEELFQEGLIPKIGLQVIGRKTIIGIISLCSPDSKNSFLSFDEVIHLYTSCKKKFNPEYINIFTNRGVELAFDSKPDDLEIFKIPQAIFSELE